jgi:hypothetical protein
MTDKRAMMKELRNIYLSNNKRERRYLYNMLQAIYAIDWNILTWGREWDIHHRPPNSRAYYLQYPMTPDECFRVPGVDPFEIEARSEYIKEFIRQGKVMREVSGVPISKFKRDDEAARGFPRYVDPLPQEILEKMKMGSFPRESDFMISREDLADEMERDQVRYIKGLLRQVQEEAVVDYSRNNEPSEKLKDCHIYPHGRFALSIQPASRCLFSRRLGVQGWRVGRWSVCLRLFNRDII